MSIICCFFTQFYNHCIFSIALLWYSGFVLFKDCFKSFSKRIIIVKTALCQRKFIYYRIIKRCACTWISFLLCIIIMRKIRFKQLLNVWLKGTVEIYFLGNDNQGLQPVSLYKCMKKENFSISAIHNIVYLSYTSLKRNYPEQTQWSRKR